MLRGNVGFQSVVYVGNQSLAVLLTGGRSASCPK